jgi:hypothetical protein
MEVLHVDHNMETLIDLFDKYSDDEIADMSDFTYEGRTMSREETKIIVSTFRASRLARGYINGGRTRSPDYVPKDRQLSEDR